MRPGGVARLAGAFASVADPRIYLHGLKLLHYFNYTHVAELRKVSRGEGVKLAPNVSFTNGERVILGARANLGARCHLWAGNETGRVIVGEDALFGPEVFLTASNYRVDAGVRVQDAATDEADVVIGRDVWLGARVMVMAGVTVGDGCVVGAGSVVTKDLPRGAIAVGVPARVVGWRSGFPATAVEAAVGAGSAER